MPRKSMKNGPAGPMVTPAPFPIDLDDLTTIENFVRTGKSKHDYNGDAIVKDSQSSPFLYRDGEFIEVKGGSREVITDDGAEYHAGVRVLIVTEISLENVGECRSGTHDYNDDYRLLPSAVMVPGGPKGWRNTLLIGGDSDELNVVEVRDGTPAATISFLCLSRLVRYADPLKLAGMLHSGKIKLLDFTKDETREVSAADRKKRKEGKTVLPPKSGFTCIGEGDGVVWHRAATVLLRHGRRRILLGQDGGTYFGCELKGVPNTIKEAFISLVPEHIRKVRGVARQGEWFVVPVAAKNVPAVTECAALSDDGIDLPVDDKDSARHTVTSSDIRIAKNGLVYADGGCLSHSQGDHDDVSMENWHVFERNTAVRSFSQEGVD